MQHKTILSEIATRCAKILDDIENNLNQVVISEAGLDNRIMAKLEAFLNKTTRFRSSIADPIVVDAAHDFSCRQNIDYFIGCILGRWDIRFATGERQLSESTNPFAPLPVCPPGMLQNEDGLPAEVKDISTGYPLRIAWDGILVDDPTNQYDIINRLREIFEVLWKDRADAIEQEACEILEAKNLRDYFRKPSGFFVDHLKRYSKSRRQAPIYWPLSTTSCSYTLWLYYQRLTDQTLYTCVNDFVDPKIKQITERVADLRRKINRSKTEEKDLEILTDLELELKDFRDELLRIAKFWKPNLNDGVQITAAPLWNLFKLPKWQATLKETWRKLEKGDYDWAHLAYSIWPDRVRDVCKKDLSVAIAHRLEDLCEVKSKKVLRKPEKKEEASIEKMDISERLVNSKNKTKRKEKTKAKDSGDRALDKMGLL